MSETMDTEIPQFMISKLVSILENDGFEVVNLDEGNKSPSLKGLYHIKVKDPKEGHPINRSGNPYVVGLIDKSRGRLFLLNANEEFPEKYHERIRELYKTL